MNVTNIFSNQKMQAKFVSQLVNTSMKASKQEDQVQMLTNHHFSHAQKFYNDFEQQFTKNVLTELKQIKNALNSELGLAIRKLQNKLKGPYAKQLAESMTNFHLQPYVAKEVKDVYKAVGNLKDKIYEYINLFCSQVLSRNIQKHDQLSLFHFSNQIKSLDKNWSSVSSRSSFKKAQILVKGFNRPQTTWLALGVTKKVKEFGPIKSTFNKQDFMGNIYLNGSDEMAGTFKLKRDLNNTDHFVIECQNRMVWVYRKSQGKNRKQMFIMDDNVQYFAYIAIKGPIQLRFQAQ